LTLGVGVLAGRGGVRVGEYSFRRGRYRLVRTSRGGLCTRFARFAVFVIAVATVVAFIVSLG
jgi:hypothetical protein